MLPTNVTQLIGLIRRLCELDSLAFPKCGESESLAQTGGLEDAIRNFIASGF